MARVAQDFGLRGPDPRAAGAAHRSLGRGAAWIGTRPSARFLLWVGSKRGDDGYDRSCFAYGPVVAPNVGGAESNCNPRILVLIVVFDADTNEVLHAGRVTMDKPWLINRNPPCSVASSHTAMCLS